MNYYNKYLKYKNKYNELYIMNNNINKSNELKIQTGGVKFWVNASNFSTFYIAAVINPTSTIGKEFNDRLKFIDPNIYLGDTLHISLLELIIPNHIDNKLYKYLVSLETDLHEQQTFKDNILEIYLKTIAIDCFLSKYHKSDNYDFFGKWFVRKYDIFNTTLYSKFKIEIINLLLSKCGYSFKNDINISGIYNISLLHKIRYYNLKTPLTYNPPSLFAIKDFYDTPYIKPIQTYDKCINNQSEFKKQFKITGTVPLTHINMWHSKDTLNINTVYDQLQFVKHEGIRNESHEGDISKIMVRFRNGPNNYIYDI